MVASFWVKGLLMEHGHQFDASNRNDAGFLPVLPAYLLGTEANQGVFLTQTAFIRPKPIRAFETTAIGILSEVTNAYGLRAQQIEGAVKRYLGGSPFYAYVMGHTHRACLTTVWVQSEIGAPAAARKKQVDAMSRMGLDIRRNKEKLTDQTKDEERYIESKKDVFPPVATMSVGVDWKGVSGPNDWVQLSDPDAPHPKFLEDVDPDFYADTGYGRGVRDFDNVPPGAYEARQYSGAGLERRGTGRQKINPAKTRALTSQRLYVVGISVETVCDDEGRYTGSCIRAKGRSSNDKAFLRWAFDPHTISPWSEKAPCFELVRREQDDEPLVLAADRFYQGHDGTKVYQKDLRVGFAKIKPKGDPHYGRFELTRFCGEAPAISKLLGMSGRYEVRAFSEEQPSEECCIGRWRFEVGPALP